MPALAIRQDLPAAELRRLARREPDRRAAMRLLAIANALDGLSRAEAARRAGMERQALRDAVLQLAPVGRRGFPAWSMAFVGRSPTGGTLHGGIAGESGFVEPALLTGERLFDTLRELVLEEEGRSAA